MQQHADSIIRVNGSRADGGEGPRGPCYLLQTVMNESRKRRPNSICGNDGQILYACLHRLLVLHPAVFLVHYLTLMSMTSVFAVSTSHTLTRTSHSVVVPFTRIIFPAFNVSEAHAHSTEKKPHRWPELRAGGKPQSHLFFAHADFFSEEPNYQPNGFRKAAYPQYILSEYGYLGRGHRRVAPSCVVRCVRMWFPSPDGYYMGYKSE